MADVTQLNFTHREVIEALLIQQRIIEGCWTFAVNFGFGAATAGPNPEESHPTALVAVTGLSLLRVEPGTPGTYVDASTLASKPSGIKKKSKK